MSRWEEVERQAKKLESGYSGYGGNIEECLMECDNGLLMELCYERGRRIEELTALCGEALTDEEFSRLEGGGGLSPETFKRMKFTLEES